jgi:hypothetical protein
MADVWVPHYDPGKGRVAGHSHGGVGGGALKNAFKAATLALGTNKSVYFSFLVRWRLTCQLGTRPPMLDLCEVSDPIVGTPNSAYSFGA